MVSRSFAVALLAVFSFTASAQQGAAGRWNASVDSEFGPFAFVFEFLVDAAGKLTGSMQSEFFNAPIKDAMLDGNNLSFKLTIDGGPNGPMNISYTGVVDSGRRIVQSGADAVIVGIDSNFDYTALTKAADEIRGGALFVASNTDSTFPIESGLLPGAGAIVAALAAASGVDPINAGKPELPMRELVRASGVAEAWVIGDRLETDIALATHEPDWESILVLTGVSDETSDFSSADHVVADLESAVDLVLSTGNRQ
jgi:ribonucleotide monophosphatase NagD (HAD superfamily)